MNLEELTKKISAILPEYWCFIAEKKGNCCERCRRFDGKIFRDDDPAKPELPLHPHCRCSWRKATVQESLKAMIPVNINNQIPSYAEESLDNVIRNVKNIYEFEKSRFAIYIRSVAKFWWRLGTIL